MAIWCFQRSSDFTNIPKIRDLEKSCKAKDQKIQELERTKKPQGGALQSSCLSWWLVHLIHQKHISLFEQSAKAIWSSFFVCDLILKCPHYPCKTILNYTSMSTTALMADIEVVSLFSRSGNDNLTEIEGGVGWFCCQV